MTSFSIWGGIGGVGATSGLLIGGAVTEGLGWEWVFFINVPIAIALLALCPPLLPESRAPVARPVYDIAGAVTVTAALVLLVYAVSEAPDAGWTGLQTIGSIAAAAALIASLSASKRARWRHWSRCASSARERWSAETSSCSPPAPPSTGR